MKILIIFSLALVATCKPWLPEDIIQITINEVSQLSNAQNDPSYTCLLSYFPTILTKGINIFWKNPPSGDTQEERTFNQLKDTCNVYKEGIDLLKTCPDGQLKTILNELTVPFEKLCIIVESKESEKVLQRMILTIPKYFRNCVDKCIDDYTSNLFDNIFPIPHYNKEDAGKICKSAQCEVDCLIVSGGFSTEPISEEAFLTYMLTLEMIQAFTNFYMRRDHLSKVDVPRECQIWLPTVEERIEM